MVVVEEEEEEERGVSRSEDTVRSVSGGAADLYWPAAEVEAGGGEKGEAAAPWKGGVPIGTPALKLP